MKKIALTLLVCLTAMLVIDLSKVQNPVRYLTNDFYIKAYQYSKENVGKTNDKIVIVNISDFPTDIIKDQIEILAKYNPAVIGVDYFVPDTAKSLQPVDYSNLVLPILLTEDDSVQFSKNNFAKQASYGYTRVLSSSYFQPFLTFNGKRYPSFSTELIKAFDTVAYRKLLKRNNDVEVINYLGNIQSFQYLGDLIDVPSLDVLGSVKNKIVLIGYTGIEGPHPTTTDTYDAHSTPQGKMFGVVLLANILHTLLDNYITPLPKIWSVTIAFLIMTLNILSIQCLLIRLRGRYLIIKGIQVIQILLFFFLASFIIHRYQVSVNYEMFVFCVIITPEIAFWSFRKINAHAVS